MFKNILQIIAIAMFSLLFGLNNESLADQWTSITNDVEGGLKSVTFMDDDNGWAVGRNGVIVHTDDGGDSWDHQESNTERILRDVVFIDGHTGWAVGERRIVHTQDAGESWNTTEIEDFDYGWRGDDGLHSVTFTDDETAWAVGNNGVIVHTDDGWENWETQDSGIEEDLHSVTFVDGNTGWAVGEPGGLGRGGVILHTEDGGENWEEQNSNTGAILHDITFIDEDTGWAVGGYIDTGQGEITYTEDGGENWEVADIDIDEQVFNSITFTDDQTGWMTGGNRIVKTEDAGENWEVIEEFGSDSLEDITFIDDDTGWAVGLVFMSDNGTILTNASFHPEISEWRPGNESVDLDPDVHFSWGESEDADTYRFQLSTEEAFGDLVVDEDGLVDPEISVDDLQSEKTYYWRIEGVGDDHGWSDALVFTIRELFPVVTFNVDMSVQYEDGNFDPDQHDGLQVVADGDGHFEGQTLENAMDDQNRHLYTTTKEIKQEEGTEIEYRYRIHPNDGRELPNGGFEESHSSVTLGNRGVEQELDVRYFGGIPYSNEATRLWEPLDGMYEVETHIGMEWSEAELAETYQLLLAKDEEFEDTVVDESGLEATEFQVTDLEEHTDYYWKVEAHNESGSLGISDTLSFTTGEASEPRTELTEPDPADGAEDIETDLTITWGTDERADTYRFQLAEDQYFGEIVADEEGLEATEIEVNELQGGTTYHWRLEAQNADGSLGWSNVVSFTTGEDEEPRTELTEPDPADGAEDIETDLTVSWGADERADTYHFQLAEDEEFEVVIEDEEGLEATEIEVNELQGGTTYHWRLEAHNSDGGLGWSSVASFSTKELVSAEPGTEVPDDYALNGNYPNPFNPTTVISYQLPEAVHVRLEVYDVMGRRVAVLVDEPTGAGSHEVSFDASEFSSGTYIYRIEAGSFVDSRIMMFVK